MSKSKGRAKRIFNNMTQKRPGLKSLKRKSKTRQSDRRHQSNLTAYKVARQRGKEY